MADVHTGRAKLAVAIVASFVLCVSVLIALAAQEQIWPTVRPFLPWFAGTPAPVESAAPSQRLTLSWGEAGIGEAGSVTIAGLLTVTLGFVLGWLAAWIALASVPGAAKARIWNWGFLTAGLVALLLFAMPLTPWARDRVPDQAAVPADAGSESRYAADATASLGDEAEGGSLWQALRQRAKDASALLIVLALIVLVLVGGALEAKRRAARNAPSGT